MNYKKLHRIIAGVVFLISFYVFLSTVQPSVSFWDCGEFIASSYAMQVPHPPGTPFFLILGRLFSMIPFADNIGLRVNMISVLSSAFTVMFLYLIAVKLIQNYRKKEPENLIDALAIYLSSAIGALSLSFSDTFWFNAVEAEVYAFSSFFIALVIWLMILWDEKADKPDNEKYLILIAYLIGLSTGVHLMSVLAIVPIVMVVVFRKYVTDEEILKKTAIIFIIHSIIILLVAFAMWASQNESTPPSYEEFNQIDFRFGIVFAVISLLFMGALYRKIFQRSSFYIPIIIGGIALISVYPGIVKYIPKLITLISGNNYTLNIIVAFLLFGVVGLGIYWSAKNNKPTLNLIFKCIFFSMIGITTYAMIIIRANQETPINMNSPKTFTELESYLNREQYGDFPIFKRRYSNEPHQQIIYSNYSSDLDFLIRYQMDHMFNRYLFWNYIGRKSTYQDSGIDWRDLYGIPFFIGLFGLYFHFRRDWKMASVFLVMFIFLGYLTAFYQNQQEPQPRERDYFYVGAFFVFSLWIAFGIRGLIEFVYEKFDKIKNLKPVTIIILLAGFIVVPVNMLKANYFEHDRSRNYVPWDYAYNLLQSVAPNAILFTNGDNDTFPLWYLQDVEGVRRDVRIANLSLLNTPWYIKQLKNTSPYGAQKVELSFTDEEIDQLTVQRWEPVEVSIPITDDVIKEWGITDTAIINKKKISWILKNPVQYGNIKAIRVQDLVVLDILMQSKWKRPVYFAMTCSEDSKLNLNDYMQMEGVALRVVPKKFDSQSYEYINEPITRKQLFDESEGFSKTYRPGFKFRGLNDKTIFFDENHERLTQNYRNTFLRLAIYYLYQLKDSTKAIETLNMMEKKIPRSVIPLDYRIEHDVALLYFTAGDMKQYIVFAKDVIERTKQILKTNPEDFSSWNNPYDILLTHYKNLKMYREALDVLNQLATYLPYDQTVKSLIEKYKSLVNKDTSTSN